MTADSEILAVAKTYLDRYGQGAKPRAQRRADALEAEGHLEGRDVWLKVVHAIERIQAVKAI
jgi:hypothetical protein